MILTIFLIIFSNLFSNKHLEIEAALRNSSRIQNFRKDEENLLRSLALNLTPLLNRRTEKRFQRLFDFVGGRFHLYQPLLDRPSAISRLARIAETSELLWNHLLNHLELLSRLEDGMEVMNKTEAAENLKKDAKRGQGGKLPER